jgi:hypothetical protein
MANGSLQKIAVAKFIINFGQTESFGCRNIADFVGLNLRP